MSDETRNRTRCDAADIDTALAEMEAYWDGLRGRHRLPQRRDVDPARIGAALPWAFLMQRVAPGVGRLRVAGRQLPELLGMDPRGMPLTAFFSAETRPEVTGALGQLFDDPAIVELPLLARRGLGRPKLEGRLILLPLVGDDGMASAALGALMIEGETGTPPRRFDLAPLPRRRDTVPRPGRNAVQETARETPARPALAGPFLRLVVDNT